MTITVLTLGIVYGEKYEPVRLCLVTNGEGISPHVLLNPFTLQVRMVICVFCLFWLGTCPTYFTASSPLTVSTGLQQLRCV